MARLAYIARHLPEEVEEVAAALQGTSRLPLMVMGVPGALTVAVAVREVIVTIVVAIKDLAVAAMAVAAQSV